ncbi:uncharacterized protein LOC117282766 [Cryptotermes secundus]|uniref:uncharacterized protein LOC117282766 n=1 Tax=Cryptotermes secundus TaxID=105785 RepID=UPI001454D571|nr:uncharacterized protein LOC117282766 [Cryptotermes secundus]
MDDALMENDGRKELATSKEDFPLQTIHVGEHSCEYRTSCLSLKSLQPEYTKLIAPVLLELCSQGLGKHLTRRLKVLHDSVTNISIRHEICLYNPGLNYVQASDLRVADALCFITQLTAGLSMHTATQEMKLRRKQYIGANSGGEKRKQAAYMISGGQTGQGMSNLSTTI